MIHNWKEQYKDNECKLAKELSDNINNCSTNLSANAEYFARFEHRYLQNELMQFCVYYIYEMAKNGEKGLYDPRNEWACKIAMELAETAKNFTFK